MSFANPPLAVNVSLGGLANDGSSEDSSPGKCPRSNEGGRFESDSQNATSLFPFSHLAPSPMEPLLAERNCVSLGVEKRGTGVAAYC